MHPARARRPLPSPIALAIAVALLCLVGLPGAAFAAEIASVMVVTCAEDDAPAILPPETICEIRAVEDDDGFFAAAPICDPSGASAVAPQPVWPIGDDKIEQTPGCGDDGSTLQLGPRPPQDDSSHQLSLTVDHAVLPGAIDAPRWSGSVTQTRLGSLLGPSEGIERRVEHPPHAA